MEEGKGARKSDNITATLMRTAVTPNNKQQSKREQEAPKKPQSAMKKGLKKLLQPRQEISSPINSRQPNRNSPTTM